MTDEKKKEFTTALEKQLGEAIRMGLYRDLAFIVSALRDIAKLDTEE